MSWGQTTTTDVNSGGSVGLCLCFHRSYCFIWLGVYWNLFLSSTVPPRFDLDGSGDTKKISVCVPSMCCFKDVLCTAVLFNIKTAHSGSHTNSWLEETFVWSLLPWKNKNQQLQTKPIVYNGVLCSVLFNCCLIIEHQSNDYIVYTTINCVISTISLYYKHSIKHIYPTNFFS